MKRKSLLNAKQVHGEFSTKFLILLLNTAEIPIQGQKYGKFIPVMKYYLIYSFIFLTTSQILSLRFLHTWPEVCIALVFIFNGVFLNSTTAVLHLKKQNFINILNIVCNKFDTNASTRFRKFCITSVK